MRLAASAIALLVSSLAPAAAHESIEHQIEAVDARVAAAPDDPSLLVRRAELHRIQGDWAAARTYLERAAALAPEDGAIELALGRLLLASGDAAASLPVLDRYLEKNPQDGDAWVAHARANAALERTDEAVEDWSRAVAALPVGNPWLVEAYLRRAQAQARATPVAALRDLDEGIERLGRPVVLELRALDLELALGRTEAALSRLQAIESRSRRTEGWMARRGRILEAAGRAEEALAAWRSALDAIEDLPPTVRRTAAVQELQQEARAAIARLAPAGPVR